MHRLLRHNESFIHSSQILTQEPHWKDTSASSFPPSIPLYKRERFRGTIIQPFPYHRWNTIESSKRLPSDIRAPTYRGSTLISRLSQRGWRGFIVTVGGEIKKERFLSSPPPFPPCSRVPAIYRVGLIAHAAMSAEEEGVRGVGSFAGGSIHLPALPRLTAPLFYETNWMQSPVTYNAPITGRIVVHRPRGRAARARGQY